MFCEDALKQQKKVVEDPTTKDFLKLSYVANPKLPFAIDCLKVRRDNVYGYHIITEQDLNIGDVVCVESPFFTIMFDNEIEDTFIAVDTCKQRCFHCFKYNNLNLISCFNCKLGEF